MILLLLVAQVIMRVLQYGAHIINLGLWALLLPLIVAVLLWVLIVGVLGYTLVIDSFTGLAGRRWRI